MGHAHVGLSLFPGAGNQLHGAQKIGAIAVASQFPANRKSGRKPRLDGEGLFQHQLPLAEQGNQLIPLPLLHGGQQLQQGQRIICRQSIGKADGLGSQLAVALHQLLRLAQESPGAKAGGLVDLLGFPRELLVEQGGQLGLREGRELQLGGAAADGGQLGVGVGGEQEKNGVIRRLLHHFEQGVLGLVRQILPTGKKIDFPRTLVGSDGNVGLHLADKADGNGFFIRLVHGDDVGMNAGKDLPAGVAPAARLGGWGRTLEGSGEDTGQRMLPAALGAADEKAVGQLSLGVGLIQPLTQAVVSIKIGEIHSQRPPSQDMDESAARRLIHQILL